MTGEDELFTSGNHIDLILLYLYKLCIVSVYKTLNYDLFRADCLTQDLEKPKPKFVKEVLEKCMR